MDQLKEALFAAYEQTRDISNEIKATSPICNPYIEHTKELEKLKEVVVARRTLFNVMAKAGVLADYVRWRMNKESGE